MGVAHWLNRHWIGSEAATVPAAPTLTLSDQQDGTGTTATIAGADGGTTNTVYYQTFSGLGTGTWTSAGSRTGNGTVDVAVTTGHYLVYVKSVNSSGASSVSSVVYTVVTAATNAMHYDILVGVQARIQSIGLSGITNASVVVSKIEDRKIWSLTGISLPAVIITPTIERSNPREGVTSADTVTYGVRVTMLEKDNQEPTGTANLNRHLLWKEQIRKAFQNQALTGVASVYHGYVDPVDCIIPAAYAQNLMATTLLLRFSVRESRGI
jgi:hypothetical protein